MFDTIDTSKNKLNLNAVRFHKEDNNLPTCFMTVMYNTIVNIHMTIRGI